MTEQLERPKSPLAALQARGSTIVEVEMMRLEQRLPSMSVSVRAELLSTLELLADRLLRRPATRVNELADRRPGSYAAALADLYELDPDAGVQR